MNVQLKNQQGNNIFPITNPTAVKFSDGKNLEEKLESINNGSGSGGSSITNASWDSITNKPSNLAYISDSETNASKTWSSTKIKNELNTKAQIMDGNTSNQYTWSGGHITEYIATELESVPTINDNSISSTTQTWSANKIDDELRLKSDSSHSHSLSSLSGSLPVSKLSGTITSSNLPVAFGDMVTTGICKLTTLANNTYHSGEAVGAHANAVKQVYDLVVTAQNKANSAYNLANHSHPYASSSHTHSNYASSSHTHSNYFIKSDFTYMSTSIYPSSGNSGSLHCGKYGNYWNYVVANVVAWNTSGGYAFFGEGTDNGKIAYDFLKQYKSTKDIKFNVADLISELSKKRDISEEEQDQINVLKKIDDVFDIYEDESVGTELYTNGTKLTETIAEGIEYLIGKLESLEKFSKRTEELENEVKTLRETIAELQKK